MPAFGSFVTYAQNFEDLMLWRALHDVADGFYIDVGAADPDEDSVTRAFYDRGWRGINIEPSPEHFAAIAAARPRDLNLRCLVGDAAGEAKLYHVPDTGLSTLDEAFAARHAADGRPSEAICLPMRTLADICDECAQAAIHFLKIDVEGAEASVLRGADFSRFRPWIVLVEATEPMSQAENWEEWDPLLTGAEYRFVWFDGLNRFYLAAERADTLRPAFRTPPNVFDGWVRPRGQQQMALMRQVRAERDELDRLRAGVAQSRALLEAQLATARMEADNSRAEINGARSEAAALRDALLATQENARAIRAEATTLGSALAAARGESAALRAEGAALGGEIETLRTTEDALRVEATAANAEAAKLQAEAAQLRADLAEMRHARDQAEARIAALLASTSWLATAPMRGLSRALRSVMLDPQRRARLRLVAGTEMGPIAAKGIARVGIYAVGRAAARVPGGRTGAASVRLAAPGPYRWLHTHYVAYRTSIGTAVSIPGQAAAPPEPQAPSPSAAQAGVPISDEDISAEERTMLLRLRPQGDLA